MKNILITLGASIAMIVMLAQTMIEVKSNWDSTSLPKDADAPPCIALHNCIRKYSDEYRIPLKYAYGVAFEETRYQGPFHWEYKHAQTSQAGAVGPMQIMYQTAKMLFPDKNFSKEDLKNDIDFNVHCSMKLLRRLYDKYGNWKLAFGAYNTGKPVVNEYSENVYEFTAEKFK